MPKKRLEPTGTWEKIRNKKVFEKSRHWGGRKRKGQDEIITVVGTQNTENKIDLGLEIASWYRKPTNLNRHTHRAYESD